MSTAHAELKARLHGELIAVSGASLDDAARRRLASELVDDVVGLGPLEPLLADHSIDEIMVNGHQEVYVERSGRLERTDVQFTSEEHLRRVIDRIVARVGRRVDESSPMVDARLPDGSRVNAIVPPLSVDGPAACRGVRGSERTDQRRYRYRQDHLAECVVQFHSRWRTHRDHRGRRRTAVAPAPRGAPGEPTAQPRGFRAGDGTGSGA